MATSPLAATKVGNTASEKKGGDVDVPHGTEGFKRHQKNVGGKEKNAGAVEGVSSRASKVDFRRSSAS